MQLSEGFRETRCCRRAVWIANGVMTKRPTVLLVDDSQDILEIFTLVLADQYDVRTARSADEAFAIACEWRPEVLLTDISMPGRSGLDLITQVRSDLAPPQPRIGVISGFAEFESAARARGAALFLLKPVDVDALKSAIVGLLGRPVAPKPLPNSALLRRATATREAEGIVDRFLADYPDAAVNATRAVENAARYFGASAVLLLILRGGELEVFATSDPDRFPRRTVEGGTLGYATSVIASGATLFIPTKGALAEFGELQDADLRLVACAAMRSPNGDPIAGVAILSTVDQAFDTHDLPIIDEVSRQSEGVLARRRPLGTRRIVGSHLLVEAWWRRLLDRELELVAEGQGHSVCASLVDVSVPLTEHVDADETIFAQLGDHMAVGARHGSQLAVFKRAADARVAQDEVRRCLTTIDDLLGVTRAAMLTVGANQPPRRSEIVLDLLEGAVAMDEAGRGGSLVTLTLSAQVERMS